MRRPGRSAPSSAAASSPPTRPASDAEVAPPALGRSVRTGADGAFLFDALPAGAHGVIARKLGHEPTNRRVTVGSGDTTTLVLTLAVRVQGLARVDVRDRPATGTRR